MNQIEFKEKQIDILFWVLFIFVGLKQMSFFGINALHCDEALYSYWALQVASGKDILLSNTLTDKFPLVSYIIALFLKVFGNSEVIVRMPNSIINLLNFLLVYIITKRIYGSITALISAILLSLSSYFLTFGPTAFTDPMLLFFVLMSVLYIYKEKYFVAGVLLGFSMMAKLTGLYFIIPFTIFTFFLSTEKNKKKVLNVRDFLYGFGIVFLVMFIWSFFVQNPSLQLFINNSPIKEMKDFFDAEAFKKELKMIVKFSLLIGIAKLVVFNLGLGILAFVKGNEKRKTDVFLLFTVIVFYLMLFFMAGRRMPIYDRYLYVIIPFLIIGTARVLSFITGIIRGKVLSTIVLISLVIIISLTGEKKIDFGAYYNNYNGIKQAREFFINKKNVVILGFDAGYWHMLYYFYEVAGFHGYSYSKEEFEKASRYIKQNEGKNIYLLCKNNKTNKDTIEIVKNKFENINGIYFDYTVSHINTVYYAGEEAYYIFKIKKKSNLKTPLFSLSESEPGYKTKVIFDNNILLKGFDIDKENPHCITYYWRVLKKIDKNWRIYVHFNDKEDNIVFGGDHYPAHGLLSFDNVEPGKNIIDKNILYVDDETMERVEKIHIGLYDLKTGKRAMVLGKNKISLAK